MKKLTAAKQRLLDNVTLIAALRLIFSQLRESGAPLYYLSDLAETTSGGTPDRRVSNYYGGRISWLKSGELNDGFIDNTEEFITEEGLRNSSAKIYPKGTLVVALYGPTVGKTAILTIDAASNQAVCAVIPRTKAVTTRYLYWFFRYKRPEFLKSSFGGAQSNISQRVIRETELPLLSIELQEQICEFLDVVERRLKGLKSIILPNLPSQLSGIHPIVARIEELAARIEDARKLRRRAVEETDQIYSSTLTSLIKTDDIAWKQETVADIIDSIDAGWSPQCGDRPAREDEWGVLKTTSVQWGNFQPQENKVLPSSLIPDTKLCVNEGDVLVTRAGPRKRVGVVATVRDSSRNLMISDKLIRLRPNHSKIDPRFLELALSSSFSQEYLVGRKTGLADAQVNISQAILKSTPVAYPPMLEQRRIVSYLDDLQSKLDALKRHQKETAAELDALLPAVLERAFRGEL